MGGFLWFIAGATVATIYCNVPFVHPFNFLYAGTSYPTYQLNFVCSVAKVGIQDHLPPTIS